MTAGDAKWDTLKDLLRGMMAGTQTGQMAGPPKFNKAQAEKVYCMMLDIEDLEVPAAATEVPR